MLAINVAILPYINRIIVCNYIKYYIINIKHTNKK